MKYLEITPCDKLRPFVNCYWYFEGVPGETAMDFTFPDGSLEIIFNIATAVSRSLNGGPFTTNPISELIGQMTQPYKVRFTGLNRFLGIRFFPHTFSCFTREPLINFCNVTIDARDVLGKEFERVTDKVHSEDISHSIPTIEEFLIKNICAKQIDSKHQLLSTIIKETFLGTINSILHMQNQTGYNDRYLQRLFRERVGMHPKLLLKIARFQRSFQYFSQENSLTEVAYECGYFDQAHFNRDFKLFTGTTPSKYLEQPFSINRFFLSPDANSYLYGIRPFHHCRSL